MKTKFLLAGLLAFLAFAQTTNTYPLAGSNCQVYGCNIQVASETDSPWGSNLPDYPPDMPFYYTSVHATFKTGLNVPTFGYRSAADIPTSAFGTGSGTFNWFVGNGTSGSFTVDLSCNWMANGKIGNYPRFLETCGTTAGPNGESAPFTRDWYATPGPRGFWSLFVLNMPSVPIQPIMQLTH